MSGDSVVLFEGTIYEEGYGWVAQKVMRDTRISTTAKALYAYLCSLAGNPTNPKKRSAFPSVSLMRKELGIKSQDTFYKHMKQLREHGYLRVDHQKDESKKFGHNIYKIIAVPKPLDDQSNEDDNGKTNVKKTINIDPDKNEPSKNANTEPYPNFSTTEKPTTEKSTTISISSTSLSDTKKDTKYETGDKEQVVIPEIVSPTDLTYIKDQLDKDSLKSSVPYLTHQVLKIKSQNYTEMKTWIGILFDAKSKVEKERNRLLLWENDDRLDGYMYERLNTIITKIKHTPTIKNPDRYLFRGLYNGFCQYVKDLEYEEQPEENTDKQKPALI